MNYRKPYSLPIITAHPSKANLPPARDVPVCLGAPGRILLFCLEVSLNAAGLPMWNFC